MKAFTFILVILLAMNSFADEGSSGHDVQAADVHHDDGHTSTVVWQVFGCILAGIAVLEVLFRSVLKKPFVGTLTKVDEMIPLILPALFAGLLCFTGFKNEWFSADFSWMKDHAVNHASLLVLWFFFSVLGAEIIIPRIRAAGAFVGLATLGGVAWPIVFTFGTISLVNYGYELGYSYTMIAFVALGAGATDVPMSLGAMKIVSRVLPTATAGLALDALRILAVGDDVAGVALMAGVHGTNINLDFVALEGVILSVAYFFGTHGYYEVREGDQPGEIARTYYRDVTVRQPLIWWGLAVLNTYVLYRAGLEPMLGGCLIFVCSPTKVKHQVEKLLLQPSLVLLLFFAFIAGGIDILDANAIGPVTWAVFVGGFAGKFKGIIIGALKGHSYLDAKSEYKGFPIAGTTAFSLCASANGTVAIIFVATALFKGGITVDLAAQATLGYLFTVVATFVFASLFWAYGRFNQFAAD